MTARPIADDLIPRMEIARELAVCEHTLRKRDIPRPPLRAAGFEPPGFRQG
jgi:hypothetical protein